MNILCLCAGGSCRSVTFATLLKYYWNKDALAASIEKNSESTLTLLSDWADEIIIVESALVDKYMDKLEWAEISYCPPIRLLDVGRDKWGMSMHPDLIPIAYKLLEETYGPAPRRKSVEEIIGVGGKYEERRRAETTGD